jgi:hypothetical protein
MKTKKSSRRIRKGSKRRHTKKRGGVFGFKTRFTKNNDHDNYIKEIELSTFKPKPTPGKALASFVRKIEKEIVSQPVTLNRQGIPIPRKHPKLEINYLKSICGDVGICLSLNQNYEMIMDMFENFRDFKYLVDSPELLATGNNGTIRTLKYGKTVEGVAFHSYGIFKTANSAGSDNLMYEYLVGKYCVNELCRIFPIFMQTYGVYLKNDLLDKAEFPKDQRISSLPFKNLISLDFPMNINELCNRSADLCLVAQYYHRIETVADYIANFVYKYIQKGVMGNVSEIPLFLFQLYYTVAICREHFTHYDLHTKNVGLVKLPQGYHIEYEFEYSNLEVGGSVNDVIRFKSKYIVKLIDYGRSFFIGKDENENPISSTMVIDQIKRATDPNGSGPLCSADSADFGLMDDPLFHYLDARINNQSQDLTFLAVIKNKFATMKQILNLYFPTLVTMIDSVYYEDPTNFGTPSDVNRPFDIDPRSPIYNVRDAGYKFANYLYTDTDRVLQFNEREYAGSKSFGKLKVFSNRPMEFEPAVRSKKNLTTKVLPRGTATRFENPDIPNFDL